ncbi:MAG TPA: ABC transporter ATP-binding protein [Acidimicrobiales bacterium]|jgi:ABC-2 type transport system ATP-binding protein|nr:ABC transporter ATP-binding protein [Acidimicrobiales bacterium]
MATIELTGLTKRFGTITAVDQLSFMVEQGSVVGFLGPNGAGKTTTLRMLLGLVAPTEGTATINGHPYRDLPAPRRVVGAVLESSGAYPGRSARNHLRIEALAGDAPRSRIDEVLDLVDLTDAADRRVGGFSLGMRQRLGLATALLGDPEILILDEPANGLDPEGVHWLRRLVRGLAAEARTVLVSSHILAEVAQTVDSVVIMDQGHLVAQSTLADLTADAHQVIRVRTPRAEDLRVALVAQGAGVRTAAPDQVEVTGATGEQIGLLAAAQSIPIFETTAVAADLEDIFLRLTTDANRIEALR